MFVFARLVEQGLSEEVLGDWGLGVGWEDLTPRVVRERGNQYIRVQCLHSGDFFIKRGPKQRLMQLGFKVKT